VLDEGDGRGWAGESIGAVLTWNSEDSDHIYEKYQATEREICQFWAQRRAAGEWKWELGAGSDKCQPGDQITLRELLSRGN